MATQHQRHRKRVVALALEAKPEAAEAPQGQPRFERAEYRARE